MCCQGRITTYCTGLDEATCKTAPRLELTSASARPWLSREPCIDPRFPWPSRQALGPGAATLLEFIWSCTIFIRCMNWGTVSSKLLEAKSVSRSRRMWEMTVPWTYKSPNLGANQSVGALLPPTQLVKPDACNAPAKATCVMHE